MARPSREMDKKLLKAGKALIYRRGVSGLSIRETARLADVNLGMFHYFFKSKKEFVRQILKEVYGEFLDSLKLEIRSEGKPSERLARALITLGRFARENRMIIASILQDILAGEEDTLEFALENFTAHVKPIAKLIAECQKSGEFENMLLPNALLTLVAPIVMPNVLVNVAEKNKVKGPFGIPIHALAKLLLADAAIEQRVRLGIKALTKEKI